MSILGLEQTQRALLATAQDIRKGMTNAMWVEMNGVINDSQTLSPTVPVDKGDLKNSKFVTQPVVTPNLIRVECGYGGAATPYALRQHEELDYRHDGAGEGAKYLSTHFERHIPTMDRRMANHVRTVARL
jgi:hypothetical protein